MELGKAEALGGSAPPIIVSEIGFAYAAAGRTADARGILTKVSGMSKQMFVDPYLVATIYVALGDKPQALEWLEKGYDVKSSFMVALASEPKWDSIRTEPRFKALVKRVGF